MLLDIYMYLLYIFTCILIFTMHFNLLKQKCVIHNLFRYEKLEEKTKAEAIEKERKEKEKGTFTNKE